MKIKKIKLTSKNKLIKLQLFKSRIYKKNIYSRINTNQIQLYFKKIIHIIYEFHISGKKILFLNFPKKIEKKIVKNFKQQKHLFINTENFFNGIISNQKINFKQVSQLQKFIKNNSKKKIPLQKLVDLIVIFNPLSLFNSDKNLYISKIPTITINENFHSNINFKQDYKIIGHFKFIEKQVNNNFFICFLNAIFKNLTFNKQKTHSFKQIIKNSKIN